VKVYIDKLVGSNWVQVTSVTDSYSVNSDEHIVAFTASVTAGNTYRIRCTFWIKEDSVTEEGSRWYSISI